MINKIKKFFNFTNTIIIVFVIAIGSIVLINNNKTTGLDTNSNSIQIDDHISGNKDSNITLYEYGDMQCPACRAFESIVPERLKEHPEIRFVFRHFPLIQIHPNTMNASIATEAASKQGKFWEMKSIIYKNQGEWENSLKAQDFFKKYAAEIGLNMTQYSIDITNPDLQKRVLRDLDSGTRAGISGTPTFFLNGQKLDNGVVGDKDAFAKAIADIKLKVN